MNWLGRFIAARGAPKATPLDRTHAETRYVVLNTRASGVSPEDDLLAVAAIAVENASIDPRASFFSPLTDHPAQVLEALEQFIGTDPVVVFNAELNRSLIERAMRQHLGHVPHWLWLDLYWLLPALFGEVHAKPARLSQWMNRLGLDTFQRHHALGDAWVIARLLLTLQSRATANGRRSPHALADLEASLQSIAHR